MNFCDIMFFSSGMLVNFVTSADSIKVGMYIVSAKHGLGLVKDRISETLLDSAIECFKILFLRDNVEAVIPISQVSKIGIRRTIPKSKVQNVYNILKSESKGVKIIWSKKSQEYDKMFKSGNIMENAKVVRDLYRSTTNPNRSYTERVIYDMAFQNIVMEIATVTKKDQDAVKKQIQNTLRAYHETYIDTHDVYFEQPEQVENQEIEDFVEAA